MNRSSKLSFFVLSVFVSPLALADTTHLQNTHESSLSVSHAEQILETKEKLDAINEQSKALQERFDPTKDNEATLGNQQNLGQSMLDQPEVLERLILIALSKSDVQVLERLIPIYETYEAKDESAIEWAKGIMLLAQNKPKEAVVYLTKVSESLPEVRLLKVQLASALYKDKQYNLAKSTLTQLLQAQNLKENDKKQVLSYIQAIDNLQKWDLSYNFSLVSDNNLEDHPAVGTKNEQGWEWTTPHQKGKGFRYFAGLDKKWFHDNGLFSSVGIDAKGVRYIDNKNYDQISLNADVVLGYQDANFEFGVGPTFGRSWYGGGVSSESEGNLADYMQSKGVKLNSSKWLSPRLVFRNSSSFNTLEYKKPYESNNGNIYSIGNTLTYFPSGNSYVSATWQFSGKDSEREDLSYKRSGVNFSWNNTWDKGIVTTASVGIATKKFTNQNFFGIKRHNHEYDLGLTVWKRDWSVFGLTPKLNLNARQVQSNDAFEEKSSSDATISLSKTF